ncbi:MAG: hypothetical protein ACLRUN_13860, partial [Christensenellales bacterium]
KHALRRVQTVDRKLFSPPEGGRIALSANERIAEFLDFAIQAKFAYVNKLKRAAPVFPLRQSPQCIKFLLTWAIFRAFPSVKKHALRRVGVSFLFFVFPLFSIYSLS